MKSETINDSARLLEALEQSPAVSLYSMVAPCTHTLNIPAMVAAVPPFFFSSAPIVAVANWGNDLWLPFDDWVPGTTVTWVSQLLGKHWSLSSMPEVQMLTWVGAPSRWSWAFSQLLTWLTSYISSAHCTNGENKPWRMNQTLLKQPWFIFETGYV